MPTLTEEQIQERGKGAFPDKEDARDIPAELVMGAVELPMEYSLRDLIKIKDQRSTLSCVGQASAQYAQVLNNIEEKKFTELSARDVYSRIFIPSGGAYLRDGMKAVVDFICREQDAPSTPTTETFFRTRTDITPAEVEKGKTYAAKSYAVLAGENMGMFKQAIFQNHGVLMGAAMSNKGWRQEIVRPPLAGESINGHAVFGCGWKIIDGKEYIEFANSWGEDWGDNGFGYVGQDYFESSMLFNPWTLVDKPNVPTPDQPYIFTRDLYFGVTGEDVKELQKYLNKTGFTVAVQGAGSPGQETTYFGWLTRAAVVKWQKAYGVYPTYGYFGPISRAKYLQLIISL